MLGSLWREIGQVNQVPKSICSISQLRKYRSFVIPRCMLHAEGPTLPVIPLGWTEKINITQNIVQLFFFLRAVDNEWFVICWGNCITDTSSTFYNHSQSNWILDNKKTKAFSPITKQFLSHIVQKENDWIKNSKAWKDWV